MVIHNHLQLQFQGTWHLISAGTRLIYGAHKQHLTYRKQVLTTQQIRPPASSVQPMVSAAFCCSALMPGNGIIHEHCLSGLCPAFARQNRVSKRKCWSSHTVLVCACFLFPVVSELASHWPCPSLPEVFLMFLKPCDNHTLHTDVKLEWYENLLILLKLETKKTEQNIANMKPVGTSKEEPGLCSSHFSQVSYFSGSPGG